MRITFVSLFHPAKPDAPAAYLRRFPLYRHLPQNLARRGHEVEFIQLHPTDHEVTQGGVLYRFLASDPLSRLAGAAVSRLTDYPSSLVEPACRALREMGAPDVIHFHGTQLHLNLALLRRAHRNAALVLHFHGGFPPRNRVLLRLQQRNFAAADAILFTAADLAAPFLKSGILRDASTVFELVETSSAFGPASRVTMLSGDPVFLSTGRLHPIKDPWTTLRGFERVLKSLPDAELHHFYQSDELLPHLRAYVDARRQLRSRVHFWGRRPYDEMETIYSSADVLLQSSTREFSGGAVLDAMACGVVPVVSDIPSFRKMTGGRHLFDVGNPASLAATVLAITDLSAAKVAARRHFERELSFEALADRAEAIYEQVLSRRAR